MLFILVAGHFVWPFFEITSGYLQTFFVVVPSWNKRKTPDSVSEKIIWKWRLGYCSWSRDVGDEVVISMQPSRRFNLALTLTLVSWYQFVKNIGQSASNQINCLACTFLLLISHICYWWLFIAGWVLEPCKNPHQGRQNTTMPKVSICDRVQTSSGISLEKSFWIQALQMQ